MKGGGEEVHQRLQYDACAVRQDQRAGGAATDKRPGQCSASIQGADRKRQHRTHHDEPTTTHPHAPDLLSWGLRRFGILRRSASCAVAASTMKVRRSASAAFSSGDGATSIAGATGTMGTTAGGSSCHSAGGATGAGGSGRRCASDATTGGGAAAAGGGGPVGVVTWTASAPSSPPRGVTIDGATRSAGALEQRPIDDSVFARY